MERVNGNEYRHKVMFRDGWVYDGDTDVVARMGSSCYMTFACGIDYPFDELQKLSDADAGRLEAALRAIQTAEAFFGDEYLEESQIPPDSCKKLSDLATTCFPVLAVLANCHGSGNEWDWSCTIHLLKHICRSLFAVRAFEEIFHCLGEGMNGKGVLVALISALFGEYADQIAVEELTQPPRQQCQPCDLQLARAAHSYGN